MERDPDSVLVGRYRLIEMIGSGGMADVWRGHDEVLDRPVAVKLGADTVGDDPDQRSMLRAEARAYGRIASRHVAQVFDYGETEDQVPFLVMEYVSGTPLSQMEKPLPWRQAVTIAAELADALRATHRCGLVHRDVKPDNVILTADGVKLVDFGISAAAGAADADANGRLLGTPGYVAPERLVDVPVDAAADVYALGVLLYRSLSGRLPWPQQTTTEALRRTLFEEPEPLTAGDGIPEPVITACMACLAKEPQARPTSAELARVLSDALRGGADDGSQPADDAVQDDAAEDAAVPVVSAPLARAGGAGPLEPTRATPVATPTRRLTTIVSSAVPHGRRRQLIMAACTVVLGALLLTAAWSSNDHQVVAGSTQAEPISCLGRFDVTRDTGAILDANLTLTNVGADLPNWQASIALAGGRTVLRPGAVLARPTDGHPYQAAAAMKDGMFTVQSKAAGIGLPADRGVVVPVRLTYSGNHPSPTRVALNGNTCQLSVSHPLPAAQPSTPADPPPASKDGGHHKKKGKGNRDSKKGDH